MRHFSRRRSQMRLGTGRWLWALTCFVAAVTLGAGASTWAQEKPRLGGELVFVVPAEPDRKSTRLNSSHVRISYAVFCLKKKRLQMMMLPLVLNVLDNARTV